VKNAKKGFLFTAIILAIISLALLLVFYRVDAEKMKDKIEREQLRNMQMREIANIYSEENMENVVYLLSYKAITCLNARVSTYEESALKRYGVYFDEGGGDGLLFVKGNFTTLFNVSRYRGYDVRNPPAPDPVPNCMPTNFQDFVNDVNKFASGMGFNSEANISGIYFNQSAPKSPGSSEYYVLPWHIDVYMNFSIRINDTEMTRNYTKNLSIKVRIPIYGMLDPVYTREYKEIEAALGVDTTNPPNKAVHPVYAPRRALIYTVAKKDDGAIHQQDFDDDLVRVLAYYGYPVDLYNRSNSADGGVTLTTEFLSNYSIIFIIFTEPDGGAVETDLDYTPNTGDAFNLSNYVGEGHGLAIIFNCSTVDKANQLYGALGGVGNLALPGGGNCENREDGIAVAADKELDEFLLFKTRVLGGTDEEATLNQPNIPNNPGREEKVLETGMSKGAISLFENASVRIIFDGNFRRFMDSKSSPSCNVRSFDNSKYIRNIADFLVSGNNRSIYVKQLMKQETDSSMPRGKGWMYGNWTYFDNTKAYDAQPDADILVVDLTVAGHPSTGDLLPGQTLNTKYDAFIVLTVPTAGADTASEINILTIPGAEVKDCGGGNKCNAPLYLETDNCLDCLNWTTGCAGGACPYGGHIAYNMQSAAAKRAIDKPFLILPKSDFDTKVNGKSSKILFVTNTWDTSTLTWENSKNIIQTDSKIPVLVNSPNNYREIYDIEWFRDLTICTHYAVTALGPNFLHRHIDPWNTYNSSDGNTKGDANGIETLFVLKRDDLESWDFSRVDYQFFSPDYSPIDANNVIINPDNPSGSVPAGAVVGDFGYRVKGMPGCKSRTLCSCPEDTPLRAFRLRDKDADDVMQKYLGNLGSDYDHLLCKNPNQDDCGKCS